MVWLGGHLTRRGASFAVRAPLAEAVSLCLFDGAVETQMPMARDGAYWVLDVPGLQAGALYGYRAAGEWAPDRGLMFDPAKLLVDPYATALDRPFIWDPALHHFGADTSALVPRAVLEKPLAPVKHAPPRLPAGGLVYELNVRGFTMLHPDVPEALRGTVAALAHPAVIAHLTKLRVNAVELMPIVAWIDERHLRESGLHNAWGYNPVALMALDPRLCPGGMAELRQTVARLHRAGIGVILDLVFNHTGESDANGPLLSLRGLDNAAYAFDEHGRYINDAGTGNTLSFANPAVRDLTRASLRHFVTQAGVDGFRFDLATILARGPGFDARAPIFAEIAADPVLADRVMIAEPWDIGPGGYQLGSFPANWLEWNDKYRDDMRRFWRGGSVIGMFTTRLAGTADIFGKPTRSVNFLAAHDGFTLADTVSYVEKHNEANGEGNRDGHSENLSWNHGVEGPSDDPAVIAARQADLRAMLSTLFASTGTIMLTAGDEFGRSQGGNNNAYAQDNEVSWIDWAARDTALEDFVANLGRMREAALEHFASFPEDGVWRRPDGAEMTLDDWESPLTDGVSYETILPDGSRYHFEIERLARRVRVDIVRQRSDTEAVIGPKVRPGATGKRKPRLAGGGKAPISSRRG